MPLSRTLAAHVGVTTEKSLLIAFVWRTFALTDPALTNSCVFSPGASCWNSPENDEPLSVPVYSCTHALSFGPPVHLIVVPLAVSWIGVPPCSVGTADVQVPLRLAPPVPAIATGLRIRSR